MSLHPLRFHSLLICLLFAWVQVIAAVYMRPSVLTVLYVKPRWFVVSHRRFGTSYRGAGGVKQSKRNDLRMRPHRLHRNACSCQSTLRNIPYGTTVPEGVEQYLYPAHCGVVLDPWPCRSARKWNRRQAFKGQFCSKVCWTWAFLGGSLGRI